MAAGVRRSIAQSSPALSRTSASRAAFGSTVAVRLMRRYSNFDNKNSNNQERKAGFDVGVGGSIWTWLKANINASGSLSDQYTATTESSFTEKSIRRGNLSGSVANLAGAGEMGSSGGSGRAMSDFKGRHFEGEIVLWAVRWYCRYV